MYSYDLFTVYFNILLLIIYLSAIEKIIRHTDQAQIQISFSVGVPPKTHSSYYMIL